MTSLSKMILEAAEQNFKMNNLKEAIFLANKAKEINPDSDCANNHLAAYTIHLASVGFRKNINWYKVLGIADTSADIETIKKSYKNLALKVHPDKNTSSGAEGAFKLIHQALDVLLQSCTSKNFDNSQASWSSLFRGEETQQPPPPPPPPTPQKNVKKSSNKSSKSKAETRPKKCPLCHGQCNILWDEYWITNMCMMCDWATHYPNDADYRYDYEYDQFKQFEDGYR